jgi:hypothetical protein
MVAAYPGSENRARERREPPDGVRPRHVRDARARQTDVWGSADGGQTSLGVRAPRGHGAEIEPFTGERRRSRALPAAAGVVLGPWFAFRPAR